MKFYPVAGRERKEREISSLRGNFLRARGDTLFGSEANHFKGLLAVGGTKDFSPLLSRHLFFLWLSLLPRECVCHMTMHKCFTLQMLLSVQTFIFWNAFYSAHVYLLSALRVNQSRLFRKKSRWKGLVQIV